MSRTSILAVIAGAALSSGAFTTASAQTSTPDKDRAYAAELMAASQKATSAAPSTGAFQITDGSGNYVLKVGGYTQFRYVMNWRDNPPDTGTAHDSGFTNGFEATRTRINFSGNIINPDMKFRIEGGWSDAEGVDSSGGAFTLLDAYGHYHFNNGMYVKWGQFKPALLREESVDNPYQLTADRSVMDAVFSQGWSQGVELGWWGDSFGFRVSANDGLQQANTAYSVAGDADWAVTARLDFKFMGDWSRFDDFTSFRNSDAAAEIGVAAHYEQKGNTASTPAVSTPQAGFFEYTVDGTYEGNGWNVYAAFVGTHTEPDEGDGFDDFGGLIQAGVFLTEQLELFGRVDAIFPDDDRGATTDDFYTLTAGVNYYITPESHAAKFTADVQWFLNEPGDAPQVAGGFFGPQALQPSSDDNQLALRLQFQLMF